MFFLFVFGMMMQAPGPPSAPKILLIAREPIHPGAEAGYDRIVGHGAAGGEVRLSSPVLGARATLGREE